MSLGQLYSLSYNQSTLIYTKATFPDLATITTPTTVRTLIVYTNQDGSRSTRSDSAIVVGPGGIWYVATFAINSLRICPMMYLLQLLLTLRLASFFPLMAVRLVYHHFVLYMCVILHLLYKSITIPTSIF